MGLSALDKLQMRNREVNGRSHNSLLSPVYHPPNGTLGLAALDDDSVNWLKRTALKI